MCVCSCVFDAEYVLSVCFMCRMYMRIIYGSWPIAAFSFSCFFLPPFKSIKSTQDEPRHRIVWVDTFLVSRLTNIFFSLIHFSISYSYPFAVFFCASVSVFVLKLFFRAIERKRLTTERSTCRVAIWTQTNAEQKKRFMKANTIFVCAMSLSLHFIHWWMFGLLAAQCFQTMNIDVFFSVRSAQKRERAQKITHFILETINNGSNASFFFALHSFCCCCWCCCYSDVCVCLKAQTE